MNKADILREFPWEIVVIFLPFPVALPRTLWSSTTCFLGQGEGREAEAIVAAGHPGQGAEVSFLLPCRHCFCCLEALEIDKISFIQTRRAAKQIKGCAKCSSMSGTIGDPFERREGIMMKKTLEGLIRLRRKGMTSNGSKRAADPGEGSFARLLVRDMVTLFGILMHLHVWALEIHLCTGIVSDRTVPVRPCTWKKPTSRDRKTGTWR